MTLSQNIAILAHDGGIIGVLIPLCLALFIFFHMANVAWTLVSTQFANLFSLYTEWETESLDKFHPYTRSILSNRCPEFALIATFKRQPQTRQVKEQMRTVVQSVIDTLEENEREPIKYAIIAQLQRI